MKRREIQRRLRRVHRSVVAISAAPLLLTVLSGALYGALQPLGIDAFWLVRLHTGDFGLLNLQPYYAPGLGLLTLVVAGSGLLLLWRPRT